ncbi:MAG TPA: slipin family protein [Syntrophomonadaceae bacterium]|nr:slipin family protein [Syntrophomonadaceae bacterium]
MFSLILWVFLIIIVFSLLAASIKVVSEWERLAILTLGKFTGIKGPGLIIIVPIIQTVASRIDTRVQTTRFQSETTLTKDGVAVTIQAVLFWRVVNAQMATLEVTNYRMAVELAAQTSMRDAIGKMNLAAILSNLEELDLILKDTIARKSTPWGIETMSVEIRDVSIPQELQEVMSRGAQAEREKQARVTYGQAEVEAAVKFVEAAEIYASSPNALKLRAMTIMYEALKNEQNTLLVVPSDITQSLDIKAVAVAKAMSSPNKDKKSSAPATDSHGFEIGLPPIG